jgi:SAM-dependent methyltransferase
MPADFYQRSTCRACASTDLSLALPLAPTPLCDAYVQKERLERKQDIYPLDLYLCESCGLVQLVHVVDKEIIYRDYIYVTTSSMGLSDHFESYVDSVLTRMSPPPGSLVVDVGSNDGTLLRAFQSQGMRVLGVEPSTETARAATENGIETIAEFFDAGIADQMVRDSGRAQVITINNLFANIDDLDELMEGVSALLAEDGIFVVESSYLGDLIDNMVFDFIYHEHLSYLALKPLIRFFDRHNMEVVDVERVDTKGGSLRYYAQKRGGGRAVDPGVGELVAYENSLGLDRLETYGAFSDKIAGLRANLVEALSELKAAGKSIAGFGGSATTTTLIYHYGITEDLAYIVDDNPAKQHTFSPGCHLPVLPSDEIYTRKPDTVVILAWRYAEPIIKNNRRYLENGGQFIVPLPELRLVTGAGNES